MSKIGRVPRKYCAYAQLNKLETELVLKARFDSKVSLEGGMIGSAGANKCGSFIQICSLNKKLKFIILLCAKL